MPNKLNLKGQKFNHLLVLEETNLKEKNGKIIWKCLCDCGNVTYVNGTSIKNGTIKSCGCIRKIKQYHKDLTGQRFDKLTVIEPTENSDKKNGKIWKCKCDCGNICYKTTSGLHKNKINSCGCITSSKGAYDIEQLLTTNNINFIKEYRIEDCKYINPLPFDFYLPDYNIMVEFDGEQHFINKQPHFEELKKIRKKDLIKTNYCLKNNYILIRIPYFYSNLTINDLLLNSKYKITKDNINTYYEVNYDINE